MKIKRFISLLLLFSLILSIGITASARTPYANYYIQEKEKTAKPIPAAYEVSTVIDFLSTETGKLKNPEDMFIDDEGKIYVADTGNNRIVVYGPNYEFLFEISSDGTYAEGDLAALKDPTGVYVDSNDGAIIVADSGNARIVEFTKYGNLRYSYPKPESELLSQDFSYQPEKVTKDSRGFMYVTNKGDSNGIMQLNSNGEFISYYGTNKVNLSFWESIAKLLWSREDRDRYSNLLELGDSVFCLSDKYSNGCMQYRNRVMVERSSLLIAAWNGTEGGTEYTYKYA